MKYDLTNDKFIWGIVGIIIILVAVLVLGSSISAQFPNSTSSSESFKNYLTGLTLTSLNVGTHTFQHEITNPYNNITIKVYSFLITDPDEAKQNCTLTSSIHNGTILQPSQTIIGEFTLEVKESNPFAEYYVKIGCLKQGEDY